MSKLLEHRSCGAQCNLPVPPELHAAGLCVSHFTFNIEKACAEMHRQIAMRGASAERQAEIAVYLHDCSLLLARITSNLSLSDQLKRRVLSTFLSLMNLRETLERSNHFEAPPKRAPGPSVAAATA